jgi:hypothetical protein
LLIFLFFFLVIVRVYELIPIRHRSVLGRMPCVTPPCFAGNGTLADPFHVYSVQLIKSCSLSSSNGMRDR